MVLNIRLARLDDASSLFKMSLDFLKASGYTLSKNDSKIKSLINDIILAEGNSKVCVVITNLFDVPVGMLAAIVDKPYFSDEKIAQELVWWVEPEYRGNRKSLELVEAYENWAYLQGASLIQMASIESLDGDKVGRILERHGFQKKENTFAKEIV